MLNRLNLIIKCQTRIYIAGRLHGKKYKVFHMVSMIQSVRDTLARFSGVATMKQVSHSSIIEQPVAVKVIDLKMLKCEINRTLLASQIQILKSMRNVPNILTLHEVYTTKNNTYIITELCESDLSRKIKKKLT